MVRKVHKLNNLIVNRLLYSWLKGICSHDGILILIPIVCFITPLDSGKWQYTAFRVGTKYIVSKCFNTLTLFSVLTIIVLDISFVFFFNSHK